MSNYATIMSFKEFKKILDSNLKNMVICYVRITSKDACEIFDERTDAPNRKSSITNLRLNSEHNLSRLILSLLEMQLILVDGIIMLVE